MSFLEIAKKRYAVREYQGKKVEKEKLATILEAGRVAPTAHNKQPQKLIVVQESEGLVKIQKAANVYGAPLAIIICGDHNKFWKRPLDGKDVVDIDASIVTDHMMLQATDLGLGSVWICNFEASVIKTEFHLPDNLEPINILAIGYGGGKIEPADRHDKTRHPLNDIVAYEKL
ncbi:MAG TPA: nitroreductase [Firmicutes bacterium]|jgi:nitroreductase|nr:nitroreductase [Bacillota bacterium]